MAVISFRPNKKDSELFKKQSEGRWRFPVALLLSICFMLLDKYTTVIPVHRVLSTLVYPFQYTVDAPGRFFTWSRSVWGTKDALMKEARLLREEQLYLKAERQQLLVLEEENRNLKSMLGLSQKVAHLAMAAGVLAVETGRVRQVLIIDKGSRAGVVPGQLVLDTEGMTGQVIDVGLMTSTVLLVSDARSAVPVRNQRTGETAILTGTNTLDRLSLLHLPRTALVQKGDVLVTSGLDGGYPKGYPVGVVEEIDTPPGEAFIRVDVKPFTKYHQNRFVLLVWPEDKKVAEAKEVKTRLRRQGGKA